MVNTRQTLLLLKDSALAPVPSDKRMMFRAAAVSESAICSSRSGLKRAEPLSTGRCIEADSVFYLK